MTSHSPLDHQLMQYLHQDSHYVDRRHLTTLSWMVTGVLLSQSLHLTEWEPFVISRANQANSYQKRWGRFLKNQRINVEEIYIPLVMAAISHWSNQRLYIALDTTMLWNQYCMIHLSIVCHGRAIPSCSVLYAEETSARAVRFLWSVEEHSSATIGLRAYRPLLRKASWLLRNQNDVMLLADRGFANKRTVGMVKIKTLALFNSRSQ